MKTPHYDQYIDILKEELVPAMGCTEPIAIAYAASKMREVLGTIPDKMNVKCSGNIVKNVKAVTVPNTGNLIGIEASAIIGMLAGDSSKELEVINEVSEDDIKKTRELLDNNMCRVELLDSPALLHIIVEGWKGTSFASVEIKDAHNNITKVIKDDEILVDNAYEDGKYLGVFTPRDILSVDEIYNFANCVDINDIKDMIDTQIKYNMAICEEGLTGKYGVGIGPAILETGGDNIYTKMKAYAASGSEARMSGCSLPVVTNSGSGNQGIASSIPTYIYCQEKGIDQDKMYRALVLSNLLTIHQKTGIGRLSAYCGVVCAASGTAASLVYLQNGTLDQIKKAMTNTLANVSGVICDGAKPSCASKIAATLEAGIIASDLALKEQRYQPGHGIVKDDIESTIKVVGRLAKEGMKETDVEILDIMLDK